MTVGSEIVRSGPLGGLPRYDDSDVFRLDGTELVACAPHCGTGGTHETAQQSFERFVFDGGRWTRWQRDGVKFVYESSAAAATAFQWRLVKVVDTHGNTVHYTDDCPGHCYYDRISYGGSTAACGVAGSPACKTGAEIRFFYELRKDVVTYPTGLSTRQMRQRLRSVAVRMDGRLVAAYALRYETSALTGGSLLHSLQQYPGDAQVSSDGLVAAGATEPQPPTTFSTASMSDPEAQWTLRPPVNGPIDITTPPRIAAFPLLETSLPGDHGSCKNICDETIPDGPLSGDFNGDRHLDLASWRVANGSCGPLNVRLAVNSVTYSELASTPLNRSTIACPRVGYVSDLNGDGADDILLMTVAGTIARALSLRDGRFTIESTDQGTPWERHFPPNAQPTVLTRRCVSADFNGDDLGDVACLFERPRDSRARVALSLATPEGGWISSEAALPPEVTDLQGLLLTSGDADGSTTADLMLVAWGDHIDRIGVPRAGKINLVTGYTAADGSIAGWTTTATDWDRAGEEPWEAHSADVDGDGRSDFLLIKGEFGSGVYVGASQNRPRSPLALKDPVPINGDHVAVGDIDGDGRDDVIIGSTSSMLRSIGDGTFATAQPLPAATRSCSSPFENLYAADQNGDGQADLVCQTRGNDGHGNALFNVWVQPSSVAVPSAHRWRAFDSNGDGRQDLFAVHFRNPGYEVYTLSAQPGGGYVLSHDAVLNLGAEPDTARWLPIDVAGPSGRPDGRSDLVLIGRSAGTLTVTTLLSTPAGWSVVEDQPWRANGIPIPYDPVDTQTWRPAELNDDSSPDLVHFRSLATGVQVQYLLSRGDGSWTAGHHDFFQSNAPSGGALKRQDAGSFRVTDLNRDHLSDFVHVEVGGGPSSSYRTIRSLISTASETWEEETDRSFQPIALAAAHRLQLVDFEGDGIPDLGQAVVEDGCVRVQAYLRQAGGWSSLRTGGAPAPCQAATGLDDRRNLVLTDVNADGRVDVRHLSRQGAVNSLSTLINDGDPARPFTWRWVDQPALPISIPDAWAWTDVDVDHDGVSELAHFGALLQTLHWGGGSERITKIDNGRGALTTIAYRAQAGARTYLPAALLPIVVDNIMVADRTYNPPVVGVAAFTYDGALWSTRYRQMVGFAAIRSEQAETVMSTGRELTDACGARVSSTAIETAAGGTVAKTELRFTPPGPEAPYTCLAQRSEQSECELVSPCRVRRADYAFDDYGNLTTLEESAGSLRRRTSTPVHPNTDDYVVDKTFKAEVLVPQGNSWSPVSRTLYGYDDDTFEHAPHKHGDLTRVTAFSDIDGDVASDTFYSYDSAGNFVSKTDPGGVKTFMVYDTDRQLFPVSACNPVGCSTITWDETFGVVTSLLDVNGQLTTTLHDEYGRPTSTVRPDHGMTAFRYLGTGAIRTEVSDDSPVDGVHWHETLLDGLGRTYRTRDEGATSAADDVLVTGAVYIDASSRPASISLPHRAAEVPRWSNYTYDAAHRLTASTQPGNAGQTMLTYLPGLVEERDELGHLTARHHDAFGREVQVDEHVTPCRTCAPETLTTSYSYDALDKILSITNPADLRTTIAYDDLGRETSITDPDRGTISRTWRADGALDIEKDANGTHSWTYDAAGRQSSRVDEGATSSQKAHWYYDRDPVSRQLQGFSIGQATLITYSVSGPNGSSAGSDRLHYDELGHVMLARHCVDAACLSMGYGYDTAGRLKNLHYPHPSDPDGENVAYRYDPAGRLSSVGAYLTDIRHDAAGQPISQTYGNGLIEQFTYDPDRLWLDVQTLSATPKPVRPVYAAEYHHDATAHIDSVRTTGAGRLPVLETFGYDELGRLTIHSNSARPSLLPEIFEYDALGRLTRTPTVGTYRYDDPAHMHAATSTSAGHTRTYDAAGNLQSLTDPGGRSLKISWSSTGMPDLIADGQESTAMTYNAYGQRVKRTGTASGTTYSFNRYLEQGPNGLTRSYWAGNQLIATRDTQGSVSYHLQDHLHSTRLITDQNQTITGQYDYEPYAARQPHTDSGLAYMNARYYDPALGQFTSPDSLVVDIYQPQSLNRYAFSRSDPMNRWDPGGHADSETEEDKDPNQKRQTVTFGDEEGDVITGERTKPPVEEPPLTPPPLVNAEEPPVIVLDTADITDQAGGVTAAAVTNLQYSNMGGACSACHTSAPSSQPSKLTPGMKAALIVVAGVVTIAIIIATAPVSVPAGGGAILAGAGAGAGAGFGFGFGFGFGSLFGAGTLSLSATGVVVVESGAVLAVGAVTVVGAAAVASTSRGDLGEPSGDLGPNWKQSTKIEGSSGCELCARWIRMKLGSGAIIRHITPKGKSWLPRYRKVDPIWGDHYVVEYAGRVYDRFGPSTGVPIAEWIAEWTNGVEEIDFGGLGT